MSGRQKLSFHRNKLRFAQTERKVKHNNTRVVLKPERRVAKFDGRKAWDCVELSPPESALLCSPFRVACRLPPPDGMGLGAGYATLCGNR